MIILNVVFGLAFLTAIYTIANFILGLLGFKLQIKIKFSYKGNPL